jgi:GNAT superfamily N-acetyltransferase
LAVEVGWENLNEMLNSKIRPLTFLGATATRPQLERAIAANSHHWIMRGTRGRGGEVRRENGATWFYSPGGEAEVAFPRLTAAKAGEQLDAIMAYYRDRRPPSVLFWSLLPAQPRDLGARLLARGFDWCWQPRWMWLDLQHMKEDHSRPPALQVGPVEDGGVWDMDDLPYYDRQSAAAHFDLTRARPQRVWWFAAWLNGRVVGHTSVNLTTGPQGVAGIFNVGVVPSARNQGIGKAVVAAACRQARELGCVHALLNGTGERMYNQIGFQTIGWGQTWYLRGSTLDAPPPTEMQVAFIEAVGRGDLAALDRLAAHLEAGAADAALASGLTPLQVAVHTQQPASAEWLVRRGATLDVLTAWDLGWRERVSALLSARPDLVNRRSGDWGMTPLHEAVQRNDPDLARILLAARPDLSLQDTQFNSTPLGWARHLRRKAIGELIEQHQPGNSG